MSDNRKEDYLKQQADKALQLKKNYDNTIKMLQTEERFVNFFKGHNNKSVENFITYYAGLKNMWYTYADTNYQNRMRKKNKWLNAALALLKNIGYKKLFNLKCRWIAGEIDLDGVELSSDFDKWLANPNSCPHIEPVTVEEFSCWLSFRAMQKEAGKDDDDDDDSSPTSAIENFHWYRSIYMDNPEELIPEWFHYYDKRFGTAPLMELSTLRKDMEQDYNDSWVTEIYVHTLTDEQQKIFTHHNRAMRKELRDNPAKLEAVREENNRKWQEHNKDKPTYVSYSVWNRQQMDQLVELIEPKEVKKYYEATKRWNKRSDTNEDAQMAVWGLNEAKEWVAIESHADYRQALIEAYDTYSERCIDETLHLLFDDYCQSLAEKKPFKWSTEETEEVTTVDASVELKKRIFEVLKLQGKPQNLDFLKSENLKNYNP